MKLVSFNVRVWTRDTKKNKKGYWRDRMKDIKWLINYINPDILCFQELSFPANLYIPKEYKRVNISFSHPIYVKKGIPTKNHKFRIHFDAVTIYDLIRIINVHSHWNRKILDRNIKQIEDDIKQSGKIFCVACGDFNNTRQDINFELLERVPFEHERDTFINWSRPEESHGIIDHFYTRNFECHAEILDEYRVMSDHFPILLDTKLF